MSDPRTPRRADLVATAALAGYSLTIAFGFARVFGGWSFMEDLVVLVAVGHGTSFLLRRGNVPAPVAVPFVAVLLGWVLTAQQYRSTLTRMLPNAGTWQQLRLEVGLVRDQFPTAVAPVLYGAGWATLAGAGMIAAIVAGDSLAFRLKARAEALVPGGVLFVFVAAVSSPRLRISAAMLLLATGVLAVVALQRLHDRPRRVELAARRSRSVMALPVATAVAIAVIAGVVGPRLPGARAEPLYETRGRGRNVTAVVSPLVEIRSRLTTRSELGLFRVNADAAAYWRLTTLPEFDGETFRLPARSLERVDGDTGALIDDATLPVARIRQQIQLLALGGKLVPVAADPIQAEGFSAGQPIDLRLNRDTNTLVTPDDMLAGDLFTVVSAAAVLTPDVLAAATSSAAPDPIFLELPADLPDEVARLAVEVTEGAVGTYGRARALQDWFRSEFDYSLEVQRGHGSSAIESFLAERVGYCEQFSATFAVMARSLGIPSRVAVGFTPGVLEEEGWFTVRGKNAHAWPEVWFDGIGWVLFEPTPGRGEPGAESYTNVPAQQDESPVATGGDAGDPAATPNPTTPSTVVPLGADQRDTPLGGFPTDANLPDFGDGTAPDAGDGSASAAPWLLLGGFGVVLALIAAPGAIHRMRRRALRRLTGAERVQRAWIRARSHAELAGVAGTAAMTTSEWAGVTADALPVAARPMRSLAEQVEQAMYARPGSATMTGAEAFGTPVGHDCDLWCEQVVRAAIASLTPAARTWHYFAVWR